MNDDSEEMPLWLSQENDHLHQGLHTSPMTDDVADEQSPLLGSGSITLQGEVASGDGSGGSHATDVESQIEPASNKSSQNQRRDSQGSQPHYQKNPDEGNNESLGWPKEETGSTAKVSSIDPSRPHRPNRNLCLDFFRIISAITFIGSVALLITQLIPLFLESIKSQGIFDLALKAYVALFCILFMLVECDIPLPFIRNSTLLQNYVSRGYLYSFLGLIGLQEAYSERVKEMVKVHVEEFHVAWVSLFIQISSWLIFSCGALYMLMGFCCLKRFRDKIQKKDQTAWRKYRSDLKRWRRENGV